MPHATNASADTVCGLAVSYCGISLLPVVTVPCPCGGFIRIPDGM